VIRRLAALAALGLIVTAGVAIAAVRGLRTPASSEGPVQLFEVRPGETVHGVARRLDTAGLLPRGVLFRPRVLALYARLTGRDRALKSGEYDVSPTQTPLEILDMLVEGRVKTYAVTLPEGLRLQEIAERLGQLGLVDPQAFLDRARNPQLARAFGIEASSFEGYLYPETYRFRRGSQPEEVIRRMYDQFQLRWTEQDRSELALSGMTLHQVVTLASIVEKETSVATERPLISAVLANRLARGMPLQTDPTVIYGIIDSRGAFNGNIRRSDLEQDTPYNTYTRGGLPPGPIASASIDSIRAVLAPAKVGYLYFVSRNDGTHEFSATLRDHAAAVARYQKAGGPRRVDPS
jgi:UPF0755 protein